LGLPRRESHLIQSWRTEEVRHADPATADFDAMRWRGLARESKDAKQVRRLLALAAIYGGATCTEAAQIGGVTLQIIRDWVLKFNARGPRRSERRQSARSAVAAQ
jgi:hypothetical protein